jgi:electron transfer flavoprotein beta subunit
MELQLQPCLQVDIADGKATVERETDNGTQVIEMNLPCVITADLRLNEPR